MIRSFLGRNVLLIHSSSISRSVSGQVARRSSSPPRRRNMSNASAGNASFTSSTSTNSTLFNAASIKARLTTSLLNAGEDPAAIDASHRPFLLAPPLEGQEEGQEEDWTHAVVFGAEGAGLERAASLALQKERPIKVLVLYGSLRERLLTHMGCDVRVYSPAGLPLKDDCSVDHPKVQELRTLMSWSEANFWCSPEQHGAITGIFKTMFDHIPLSTGSVRPTQGKICAVSQVNGGSQSFNAVNTLRLLGRWMRMFVIPNQASLPKAWTAFASSGRMLPSSNRDRLVDVCEELVKVTSLFGGHEALFADRWSERVEREKNGMLLTQAQKEDAKRREEEARVKKTQEELE